MKAVLLQAYGDVNQLKYQDTDIPEYGDDGEFSIPIARTMPLSEIQEAHRIAEARSIGGKIVLTV